MRVLLIGNYAPDRQQSMQRYAQMMLDGLREAAHDVVLATPRPVLNRGDRRPAGLWKWVGYLDKLVLAPRALARAAARADVVHVCDHSNAVYVPRGSRAPYVVTCHDLLAVRGALGEDTDCPATFTGRQLQRAILSGLQRADAVACVSSATFKDAKRLLNGYSGELQVVPNALNYPYRQLDAAETRRRLAQVPQLQGNVSVHSGGDVTGQSPARKLLDIVTPYVLQVGSGLRRKNRECTLRALASVAPSWPGKIVFAGERLDAAMTQLAAQLGVSERVIEVSGASNELLEALYNGALALLFPSRFEGFGWPIVEAQACGCPVICSDREPFPEVAGGAAIACEADDAPAFGRALLRLAAGDGRADLVRRGLDNAARYGRPTMIRRFVDLYEHVAGRA